MPSALIADHIFADSLPGTPPAPDTLNLLNPPFDKLINKLVAVKNVRFPDAGSPYVTGGVTTSRNIGDITGNPITINGNNFILYTSNYASFSTSLLPAGVGTLKGIFTVYSGKYEMLIRDLNDVVNFVDTGQTIIYQNNFDVAPPDWVIFTPTSNKPWAWDGTYFEMTANGYGGNVPCETWLISPALDLTNVTNPVLTFNAWTKYTDTGLASPLEVKLSTNYAGSGDPSTATWSNLQCNLPAANSGAWLSSGDISLSTLHQPIYVAFRYRSSGISSSTASKWEIDAFKLSGKKN